MTLRQREERIRDRAYLGWVARLPCVACMVRGKMNWRVQVAHVRAGCPEYGKRETGKAEKPSDRWTLPLCMPHHTGDKSREPIAQHDMDELEFWAAFGIEPFGLCIELNQAYAKVEGVSIHGGVVAITKAAARGRRIIEGSPS